jgi:hypothetical protein
MVEYFCPICNSRSIEVTSTDPPPTPVLKSMDEMIDEPMFTTTLSVLRYHGYKARCLNCGHEVKFTRAY